MLAALRVAPVPRGPRPARLCPGRPEAAGEGRLQEEDDQQRTRNMPTVLKIMRCVACGLLFAVLLYAIAAAPGFLCASSSTVPLLHLEGQHDERR